MKRRALAAVGVVAATMGCFPSSNVCSTHNQPLGGADGGGVACAVAEDCPRGPEVLVCVNDGLPTSACVSCEVQQCVLHAPVPCQ